MADVNKYRSSDLKTLGWTGADVTPNDDADLARDMAIITCLVAGDIKVTTSGGSEIILYCQAGGYLPAFIDRVWATGTTATGIKAIYNQ